MAPLIGISTNYTTVDSGKFLGIERIYVNKDYVDAIVKSGGIPLLLPPRAATADIRRYTEICDGFLLSGGGDINPLFYHCPPHPKLESVHTGLDEAQLSLTKAILETGKPLLAICRGIQLLNVALGGTLYQDMCEVEKPVTLHSQIAPRADKIHRVQLSKGSILNDLFGNEIEVNSFHHQCIKIIGRSLNISATAEDGIIEAVEMENRSFVVGIQWHPEMMLTASDEMMPLFREFTSHCK